MNKSNLKVEAVSTINYQFTAIPTIFIYLMDNDCFKLFSILLQKESYWNNKSKLNDGYFIKSISELSDELGLSNRKDVHTIIEALYIRNIIDVVVEPRKYKTAKFKLNWEIINSYLDKSIYDVLEFEEKITKLNRNSVITYTSNVTNNVTSNDTNIDTIIDTKCNTTINNINNIDKIENKDNINNIDNNINNKIEEKENNIINDIIKEKEVNLNKIEILEIEENIVNMDNLENEKNKFYFNINKLIKKMKGLTKEETKQKLVLLNNWIKNHSYFKFLQINEMNDELDNITSIVQKGLNEIRKEMKNDITVTSTPLDDINTSTDENNTSTLEKIKTIETYSTPNSLFNTSSTSSTDDLDYSQWDKEKYQFPWNDPECERRKQQYQQTHYIKTDVYYI